MISPITAKEMKVQIESRTFNYRKESFTIKFHYYLCKDSGEKFEDEWFANLNHSQVLNKYRAKYNLPFTYQILELRKRYGLSASKMSDILGFGANTYRSYESGEVPSTSNSRLLQLAFDSEEFLRLANISNALSEGELNKLITRIEEVEIQNDPIKNCLFFLSTGFPNEYNGYKPFSLLKTAAVVNKIVSGTETFKTKLNKLLFYIDFDHFRKFGNSITGLQYNAISWGPVPNNFNYLYANLIQLDYIQNEFIVFPGGHEGERFLPGDMSDKVVADLTKSEEQSINYVIESLGNLNSTKLSSLSHSEPAWIENKDNNGSISYEYGFDLKAI